MTEQQIRECARLLGKRGHKKRLKKLGIERIQEIARENGKKGGRPPGSSKTARSRHGAAGPQRRGQK